ncbi:MAG: thioredoxin fold domain-containing protein [Chloroflexota bacterium]|nr:thioredoxin fold domain-containing protein [Chloroflexota bacterium]
MSISAATRPDTAIEWETDLGIAQVRARKERKPILIDVYQDNCGGCDKLDDETFADPAVTREVASRFVPLKLDLFQDREFTRQHQVFWTPTILIADHSGKVRYTSVNYLPAAEFLDILDIGEGMAAMRWKGYDKAINLFTGVQDRTPAGPLTPEAIYWRGIAAYFRDRKSPVSANAEWAELLERFPDSIWAKRVP